jgi:hypothetical protein
VRTRGAEVRCLDLVSELFEALFRTLANPPRPHLPNFVELDMTYAAQQLKVLQSRYTRTVCLIDLGVRTSHDYTGFHQDFLLASMNNECIVSIVNTPLIPLYAIYVYQLSVTICLLRMWNLVF